MARVLTFDLLALTSADPGGVTTFLSQEKSRTGATGAESVSGWGLIILALPADRGFRRPITQASRFRIFYVTERGCGAGAAGGRTVRDGQLLQPGGGSL